MNEQKALHSLTELLNCQDDLYSNASDVLLQSESLIGKITNCPPDAKNKVSEALSDDLIERMYFLAVRIQDVINRTRASLNAISERI